MGGSKHAGSEPEAFWLRRVMAITASVQPESGRMVHTGTDFPHPIRFLSSKEGQDHLVENRPGSDLDGLVRFGPNASGPEASRGVRIMRPGSGKAQPARNQFPTFRLGCVLPQATLIILCKTGPDPIWFLMTVSSFWPNGSGPETSVCTRIMEPASGQRFRADPNQACLLGWVGGGGRGVSGK